MRYYDSQNNRDWGWPTFLGCDLLLVVLQNVLWVRDTADELLTESNRISWVIGAGRFDLSIAGKGKNVKRWPVLARGGETVHQSHPESDQWQHHLLAIIGMKFRPVLFGLLDEILDLSSDIQASASRSSSHGPYLGFFKPHLTFLAKKAVIVSLLSKSRSFSSNSASSCNTMSSILNGRTVLSGSGSSWNLRP
jgi:hypothetical protein